MWELDYEESWVPKNWCFELQCWRSLLRVPWTARRCNQSILKEISSGCSLEDLCWSWNSSTLTTWCEELTHWKRPWCWERLRAGGEGMTEDEMVGWHHRLNGHEFGYTPVVGDGQGGLACYGITKSRTPLSDWTELKWMSNLCCPARVQFHLTSIM